ncbi:MAG: RNA methyltransferase [Spirochaetia bacterium]|jgi:tRNA G18 (ribose-2'-O)-methylase SpoU|nr:RNA methyltransferase [Spirochaetia bacterium]
MEFDPKLLADLKDKDYSKTGLMVLEGRIVIEKALECGVEIIGLLRSPESGDEWIKAHSGKFPVVVMDHSELCSLAGFKFHHGALALARRPALLQASELRPRSENPQNPKNYLCLWNVTDPSNVGALIRSAAGLGAAGLLLGDGCADPYYRKALRASMGNAFALPLYTCDESALQTVAQKGFDLIAATLSERAQPLPFAELPARLDSGYPARTGAAFSVRPLILILGNEGFGLPAQITQRCSREVYIPMSRGVDSLNVVVAGSICMYALFYKSSGAYRTLIC